MKMMEPASAMPHSDPGSLHSEDPDPEKKKKIFCNPCLFNRVKLKRYAQFHLIFIHFYPFSHKKCDTVFLIFFGVNPGFQSQDPDQNMEKKCSVLYSVIFFSTIKHCSEVCKFG